VTACHSSLIRGDDPVALKVAWIAPGEELPRSHEEHQSLATVLGNQHTTLRKAAAILAYADALQDPSKDALSAAHTKVTDLLAALEPYGGDPELEEIKALIERHPIY
jgi:hypothetical protein